MNSTYRSSAYLVGYYGMRNTGDDALMTAALNGIEKWLKAREVRVSSPLGLKLYNGEKIRPSVKELQQFRGQNRALNYLRAVDSNRIVFGGGSVFHNAHDIGLKRDLMCLSGGRSHMALGVGIGPFVNAKAERSCAKFLKECSFTGVRDPLSYEVAKDIAPSANVHLTFDLAPQLLMLDGFELQSVERQGIAVCLCPRERLSGDYQSERKRLKQLAEVLIGIQKETHEPIYFVDFNGHSDIGDRQVHLEVASYLPTDSEHHFVRYDANPLRVLQRMATFKVAISMRLHASIFSFLTETPVIGLNYHQKCSQWNEQIGQPGAQAFDVSDLDSTSLVNTVCQGISSGFSFPKMGVTEALNQSMKNWRISYEQVNQANVQRCYSSI